MTPVGPLLLLLLLFQSSVFSSMEKQPPAPLLRSFSDATAMRSFISDFIVSLAEEALQKKGRFVMALSGGSMPKMLTGLVGKDIRWSDVWVLFADERCVDLDHDDSNYKASNEMLLRHLPLPPENVLKIKNVHDPDEAARGYEDELKRVLSGHPIDLVLLGLGPDGHTASLFPGHELIQYSGERMVLPIYDSPKPPNNRITLTLAAINNSPNVLFIATGESKAEALRNIFNSQKGDAKILPPSLIKRPRLTWVIDEAASCLITEHIDIQSETAMKSIM